MGLIKRSRIEKAKQRRLKKSKAFDNFSSFPDENLLIDKTVAKRSASSGDLSFPYSTIKKRKENEVNVALYKKNEVADEDEEIKYLEKKLGLHGASKKKNLDRLKKEWKEIDGLDDWLDLADNILSCNENSINKKGLDEYEESSSNSTSRGSDSLQTSTSSSSDNSLSDCSYRFNKNDIEIESILDNHNLSRNNDVSFSTSNVKKKKKVPETTTTVKDGITKDRARNTRESINSHDTTYASLKSDLDSSASFSDQQSYLVYDTDHNTVSKKHYKQKDVSVYRDSASDSESDSAETSVQRNDEMDTAMKTSNKKTPNINREEKELSNDIQTKITRYVNRIAEGNLSLITEQIIDEIFVSSTHSVVKNKSLLNHKLSLISKSFATQIVLNAIENTCSTPSLVASQTAVVIVLTVRLGYTIGEQFIVSLILTFHNLWNRFRKQAEYFLAEENSKDLCDIKICLRFASIAYSLLFDFGLISTDSVFVFIRFLMKDDHISQVNLKNFVTEMRFDLVLVCLRHIGIRLKATSSHDLNEILKFCLKFHDNVDKNISKRHLYFIEELQDMLHHNKFNHSASERYQFIREWLQTTMQKSTHKISKNRVPEELVFIIPSWDDIIHHKRVPKCALSEDSKTSLAACSYELTSRLHQKDQQNTPALLSLAKKLRLHTDIQISTFLALLNAPDVSSGVQRVLQVANKKNLIPHAVAVIFYLCQKERTFNSFYPEILLHLSTLPSSIGKQYRKTLQQGVSSTLNQIHLWSFRRIMIYAKLVSSLICSPLASIDLKIIRFVPFKSCRNLQEIKKIQFFLLQVCTELCLWNNTNTSSNDAYTDYFVKQLQSIAQYKDIAKIFVSAAERFLKDNYDPLSQEKAKLVLSYLRE